MAQHYTRTQECTKFLLKQKREWENTSWDTENSLHEISFLESYRSSCICLMRLTLERCIEHVRHPVPVRSGKKITSENLTTHFVF